LYVKAVDSVDNEDPTPAEYSWTIDTSASETTIDSHPDSSTASTSATFEFSSDDENATFQCKLDSADYATCTSPQDYTNLALGDHTFSVKAIDEEHNEDPTPASFSWTITETPAPTNQDENNDNERDLNIHSVKADSTENTITITWKTDYNTKSAIRYGTDKNLKEKKKDNQKDKNHKAVLKNLLPNTKYYFRIKVEDGDNNEDSSQIHSIKTPPKTTSTTQTIPPSQNENQSQAQNETSSSGNTINTTPNVCSYTVQSGDSLWSIAKKVYGDATQYSQIVEKNKDKYPNIESKLNIGDELTLCSGDSQKTSDNNNANQNLQTAQDKNSSQTQQSSGDSGFRWWNPFTWF
jgi:LysM repeat protein